MRDEIAICRGKDIYTCEWVEGRFVYLRDFDNKKRVSARIYSTMAETDCGDFYPDFFEVIPETVGEYTGLKDRNGTRIYEGDIVRYGDTLHEVVFETRNGTAYFGLRIDENETWAFGYSVPASMMTVEGNIYDNPDLIGVKQ